MHNRTCLVSNCVVIGSSQYIDQILCARKLVRGLGRAKEVAINKLLIL